MTIAILFAHRKSVYKTIPGVDVWDEDRDARLWPGGCPVVAHPPCRAWGRFSQFAKPKPWEKQLAIDAVTHIRRDGGVLEHPRHSKLWRPVEQGGAELPWTGEADEWGGFTLEVEQVRWGHPCEKATFLYIAGCAPEDVPPIPPYRAPTHVIETSRRDRDEAGRRIGLPYLPKSQREHTPEAFAVWLVELASRCSPPTFTKRVMVPPAQLDLFDVFAAA